jgi:hypothetical protein
VKIVKKKTVKYNNNKNKSSLEIGRTAFATSRSNFPSEEQLKTEQKNGSNFFEQKSTKKQHLQLKVEIVNHYVSSENHKKNTKKHESHTHSNVKNPFTCCRYYSFGETNRSRQEASQF